MENICIKRRSEFAKDMPNSSMLVLFAGSAPSKQGDQFYNFVPNPNFYYLSHIDSQNIILIIKKDAKGNLAQRLYLERYDETVAKWDGAVISTDKAKEISGIDSFGNIDEFEKEIVQIFISNQISKVYLDMENRSLVKNTTNAIKFSKKVKDMFPYIELKNAYPLIAKLRMIKSDCEIEKLQKASDITIKAFYSILDNIRPGMMEYEAEAYIDYTYKANNSKGGFRTIMASGKNATILHYDKNDSKIEDNSLILTDFGAGYKWYSSDITRTYPANGKFTQRQAQIYNIVLEANKMAINMIKPGVLFSNLNKAVKEYFFSELSKIGMVKEIDDVNNYYYHGVSHFLGIETHDLSFERGIDYTLEEGMVLTIEPGLYIENEGIGIRIEDDILVTKDGYKNLTEKAIKEISEIEEYMEKR